MKEECGDPKLLSITGEINVMNSSLRNLDEKISELQSRNQRADEQIMDIRDFVSGQKGYYKAQELLLATISLNQKEHHERVEKTINDAIARHENSIVEHSKKIGTLENGASTIQGKTAGVAIVMSFLISTLSLLFTAWEWIKSVAKGHP